MATLLKGKDAQRNPKTGLELGIYAATIPNLNPERDWSAAEPMSPRAASAFSSGRMASR